MQFLKNPCKIIIALSFLSIFLVSCQSAVIKRKDLYRFNRILENQSYTLKEDVTIEEGLVYKKGMLLKIWIESTPSLLKIKCFPSGHDREAARGKLLVYYLNETFKKKEFTFDDLKEVINRKLDLYE